MGPESDSANFRSLFEQKEKELVRVCVQKEKELVDICEKQVKHLQQQVFHTFRFAMLFLQQRTSSVLLCLCANQGLGHILKRNLFIN